MMNHKILFVFCLAIQISLAQTDKTITNYNEPFRPQFHFSPPSKWMNDPNGLVYFKGIYHLFYQYFPNDIVWGPMHWGHATSKDLLHWNHEPIALFPDKLGWIFSGSAIIDQYNTAGFGSNAMIAIFTYHNDDIWKAGNKNTESQGLAYSIDEGKTWKKYIGNPVLNNAGEQDFRDPKVFWNDINNNWNMVLAAGDKIKIFSSSNLKQWNYESDFKPINDNKDLGVWECPDLFPMKIGTTDETKWVMIVNHGDKAPNGGSGTRYFVGDFDGKTFTAKQNAKWLDGGTDFYAAVTFSNIPDDNKIILGWMSNWQYATKVPTNVWRSAMTLPRSIKLQKGIDSYYISQSMIPQFSTIVSSIFEQKVVNTPFKKENIDLSQTSISFNSPVSDFEITFSNSKGEIFTINLTENTLTTDRSHSGNVSFSELFASKKQTIKLEDSITAFQFILDKSSVEILLNNGKYSITNLFFPTEPYSILSIKSPNQSPIFNFKINSISRVWK